MSILEKHLNSENVKELNCSSDFLKYFDGKWDNLFLYKNGFSEHFVSDKSIKNYLANPKDKAKNGKENIVTDSFVQEFLEVFSKSREFIIRVHTIFNTEDETDNLVRFAFIPSTTQRELKSTGKYIPVKELKIKLVPEEKTAIELVNTEELFLQRSFNEVDFSKTVLDSEIYFNNIKEVLKSTLTSRAEGMKSYNSSDFINTFLNLCGSFGLFANINNEASERREKPIDDFSKPRFFSEFYNTDFSEAMKKAYFSRTIGFSIKHLLVEDLLAAPSDSGFVDKKRDWKRSPTRFVQKIIIEGKESKEIEDNFFTLCYFSPFTISKDTSLTKIYRSKISFDITQKKDSTAPLINDPNSLEMSELSSVTILDEKSFKDEDFIKSKLKCQHTIGPEAAFKAFRTGFDKITGSNKKGKKDFRAILKLNKSLSKNFSNLDFITGMEKVGNKIKFVLEYTLLTRFDHFLVGGELYKNAHLFEPKICLESINGREGLLEIENNDFKKIYLLDVINDMKDEEKKAEILKKFKIENSQNADDSSKEKNEQVSTNDEGSDSFYFKDNEVVVAHACKTTYSINIDHLFAAAEIRNPKALRSLSHLYKKKHFYTSTEKFGFEYQEIKSISGKSKITTNYPLVIADFNLNFKNSSLSSRDKPSVLGEAEVKKSAAIPIPTQNGFTPEVDNSISTPPEAVLKVTEKETNEFLNSTAITTTSLSTLGNIKAIQDASKKINDVDYVYNYFELNNITSETPRGRVNKTNTKNVNYTLYPVFNPYQQRRGNVQPALIALLDQAVALTQKEYPELLSANIMSGGTMPIDIWSSIVNILDNSLKSVLSDQRLIRESVANRLKEINIYVDSNNQEKFNEQINTLLYRERGNIHDSNHSLGFGCDVWLKRSLPGGKTGYVCLYDPKDEKDFLILRYFVDCCFKLGASSVGAGIFYMQFPGLAKYNKRTQYTKYKNGLAQYHNKFILGSNNVPIFKKLNSKGQPIDSRNAIHIDISQYNHYVNEITHHDNFNQIALYVQNYKKIKNRFRGVGARQEGKYFELEELKKGSPEKLKSDIISRTNHPGRRSIWGSTTRQSSAETWLRTLINRKANTKKAYNFEQINSQNYNDVIFEAFKIEAKPHGDEKEFNYVQESQIIKNN